MRSSFFDTAVARRFVALALVLWLGGAGCLLGCELMPSASASDESGAVDQEALSCPTTSEGACCHQLQTGNGGDRPVAWTAPSTGGDVSCCPLAGQSAIVVKPRVADAPALALNPSAFLIVPHGETRDAAFHVSRRVPDKGGTYLRCCVFLI